VAVGVILVDRDVAEPVRHDFFARVQVVGVSNGIAERVDVLDKPAVVVVDVPYGLDTPGIEDRQQAVRVVVREGGDVVGGVFDSCQVTVRVVGVGDHVAGGIGDRGDSRERVALEGNTLAARVRDAGR